MTIPVCIAVDIDIATYVERPITTQDVASDLHALRPDWLIDASGNGSFNGIANP